MRAQYAERNIILTISNYENWLRTAHLPSENERKEHKCKICGRSTKFYEKPDLCLECERKQ